MTIEAKIVCDSLSPNGVRITTFVLKYPRFIHSEFLTHRAFSRNASSSRAIPFEKQVQMIEEDMAMPLEFRKNQKGMQAGAAIEDQEMAKLEWSNAGRFAIMAAKRLSDLGIHKQYVNRLIEPFSHITVVCTATEFANFFALRHHSMAQPEIAELARQMWELYKTNKPKELKAKQWHLPFVSEDEQEDHMLSCSNEGESLQSFEDTYLPLIKQSVARCARVSYLNHEGKHPTQEEDFKLYDRLLGNQPIHASPAEHQACCEPKYYDNQVLKWSGNFRGWIQYRQTLENQNITKFEGPIG